MKTIHFIMIVLITSLSATAQTYDLKVVIEDIEESKGIIYVSLHDNEEGFPSDNKKAVRTKQIKDFSSKAIFTFDDLQKGEYAISIFQDLNGNAELDTNFIGIPKEPVGASNMSSLGRPNFSKCKFKLTQDKAISLGYMN